MCDELMGVSQEIELGNDEAGYYDVVYLTDDLETVCDLIYRDVISTDDIKVSLSSWKYSYISASILYS
jgi:hypothetical protein